MVLLGILVFGAVLLLGVYLSPHGKAPAAPASARWGVPARRLRIVMYDLRRQRAGEDPTFEQIAKLKPDYLLLQGVEEDDAVQIAVMLGMQQSFHPQLFQRSMNLAGRRATYGNCVLSRWPLYEGSPWIGQNGPFGARATSVLENRKVLMSAIHFAPGAAGLRERGDLLTQWRALGSPPMVLGIVTAGAPPSQALRELGTIVPVGDEKLVLAGGWSIVKDATAPATSRPANPAWVDITPTR